MNTPPNRPPVRGRRPAPQKPKRPIPQRESLADSLREFFSGDNLRRIGRIASHKLKCAVSDFAMHVFYSRERILCGVVATVLMILMALLQTTLFSTLRIFGAIPDIMLSFVVAISITEGEKWGAVWGIIAAVVIESLGVPDMTLLPLLYMPVGYFCGFLCKNHFTGSAAVRAVFSVAVLPLRGIFTAIYMVVSPLYATAGEIVLHIVLPEMGATLLLAAPVHLILYLCLRPFHKTRAEMVSER